MKPFIWGALFICAPTFSMAHSEIPAAYVLAATRHGVPAEILYAVASTESIIDLDVKARPWPWTLNVAGKGLRFDDRDAACQALKQALLETQLVDVGITQLNVRWQPQLFGEHGRFRDPCDGLDPYANLDAAAELIRHHYDDTSDWLVATGRYHRPAGGAPAVRYRSQVKQVLKQLSWISSSSSKKPKSFSDDASLHAERLTWITPKPYINSQEVVQWVEPDYDHDVALSH